MFISIRRRACLAGTVMLSAFCAGIALSSFAAEPYPSQSVRLVVGWAPGGYTDALARALAARLTDRWKTQVVVDNRPGASEIIAASMVSSAKPDGYTLFFATDQALLANQFLYSKLPYSASRNFVPVTRVATAPAAVLVRADGPYSTLRDLVEAARRAPGKLTYGSNGPGSQGHLIGNWFAVKAGVQLTHVPYKGGAPAVQALLAGEVDMVPIGLGSVGAHLKANTLRALAVTSPKRIPGMPDVPTFIDAGYDVEVQVMFAMVAPAGTDANIVTKIARDVREIITEPGFAESQIERHGNFVVGDTPQEFADYLANDVPRVRARIAAAKVKLD